MDSYENIIGDCENRMQSSLNNFNDNLKKIRTGRANPSMLDGIMVDYYGTETPLNQCCSITVEDSKTLSLSPWDKSLVQEIDRAIQKSDLGINPTVAGEVLRIIMPPLTEESRKDLTKRARNEAENARVAIRNIRRDSLANESLLMFLIATLAFSASFLARLVRSFLDSSVSGGMIILKTSPATVGLIPKSDF